jgi:hypothetical protein
VEQSTNVDLSTPVLAGEMRRMLGIPAHKWRIIREAGCPADRSIPSIFRYVPKDVLAFLEIRAARARGRAAAAGAKALGKVAG